MGICLSSWRERKVEALLKYQGRKVLRIKRKDFLGRICGFTAFNAVLTRPSNVPKIETVFMQFMTMKITSCVLPGLDPKGFQEKECQDSLVWAVHNGSFLACLFDGHGFHGQAVASFCSSYVRSYFLAHSSEFPVLFIQDNPAVAIRLMLEQCDSDLNSSSHIDVSMSGTCGSDRTAVVLYVRQNEMFAASLGDSRALLGSVKMEYPGEQWEGVQISVDQKPNHQQELERIVNSGGTVGRMESVLGEKVGPYRVWTGDHEAGLAMSRSLGDALCHTVGVISTPIIRNFRLYPSRDRFLVLASDGIWCLPPRDVMSNEDVISFLGDYSAKAADLAYFLDKKSALVTERDTTLAHLLCEEARERWFPIVEEEDVMIDDISCVVIELVRENKLSGNSDAIAPRRPEKLVSIATIEQLYQVYPQYHLDL